MRAALLATAGLAAIGGGAGRAETINGALIKAYLTNPDINTQRAAVRVDGRKRPEGERWVSAEHPASTGNIAGLERAQIEPGRAGHPLRDHCQAAGLRRHRQRDGL